ncbi:hypothetical protein LSH36_613g00007 [Paralvinella palmiformis]|uniref:Uncharacterized protein n=1 Tax=Paralvinella palmiformis TaxID=53620 RepID=A0AAD9J599_9ANNE|nr:hypothetical protein LSH36_613g00007 [Paralvinella palmiformis]
MDVEAKSHDLAENTGASILRGDIARLRRCTAIMTGTEGALPRCKPFKYTYEKEIVMYAYFKKLDYFSTECIYSPNAYRLGIGKTHKIRKNAILEQRTTHHPLSGKKPVFVSVSGISSESLDSVQSNEASSSQSCNDTRHCQNTHCICDDGV